MHNEFTFGLYDIFLSDVANRNLGHSQAFWVQ